MAPVVGWLVDAKLGRILKESVGPKLRYDPGIYLEGLGKTKINISIAGVSTRIPAGHLSSTSLCRYRCRSLLCQPTYSHHISQK
jgi:hypothetical protein